MNGWKRAAAAAGGALLLLWLDGWLASGAGPAPVRPPEKLRAAFSRAAEDLQTRAVSFAGRPEVVRSLHGGGVAVDRTAIFAAAR